MAFSAPSPHFPSAIAAYSRGAVMGASYEANAVNTAPPSPCWTTGGWVAWMRRYAKGAIDLPASRVFATGGYTSTQIINTWLGPCVAAKPAWCFVDALNNDLLARSGVTNATMIDNLTTIITALMNAGIYVILVPCRVLGPGRPWTNPELLQVGYVNQWMKSFCENNTGATYWEVNPLYLDFASGNAQANLLVSDSVHDNTQGAQLRGLSAWNSIKSMFPARDSRFMLIGDTYDAIYNATGNLLSNGLLAGTSGQLSGATGQAADGWHVYTGSQTVSAAASKTAYSGYLNLAKQTIRLQGTADSSICTVSQDLPATSSSWSAGDQLVAEVEVDWNISSGSVVSVFALITQQLAGTLAWDGYATNYGDLSAGGAFPGESVGQSIVLRTEPVTISANTTDIIVQLGVQVGASGSVDVTVNWARASLRKVF